MTAAPALATALKFKVTVSNGRNMGQAFVFDKPVITVGRGPENDLVFGQDQRMSRTHFEIIQRDGKLMVKNISQKNYLLVDNERTEEGLISNSSYIQAGDTILQIQFEENVAPVDDNKTMAVSFGSEKFLTPVVDSVVPQSVQPKAAPAPAPAVALKPAPKVAPAAYAPPPPPSSFVSSAPRASRSKSSSRSMASSASDNSRMRFYIIIAVVGGLLFWVLADDSSKKKPEVNIRTEGDVSRAIQESALAVQEIQKKQSASGQDSVQYKAAQEHYIRGFRDYRQGQYARSMQSFQAALSFYPAHELARKYYVQAQRKFEAQIDFAMSQGRKYYQKNNYRMCQSSFASVMIMVKDSTKPKYKEAKQFYNECSLRMEGRI